MTKSIQIWYLFCLVILLLSCETQISDYDQTAYKVTAIDQASCELFYDANPAGSVAAIALEDTSFYNMDSLYAYILGDTSSYIAINNLQTLIVNMNADTAYLPVYVGQSAAETYFFGDAFVDVDVIDGSGNINVPESTESTLENIAGCPEVKTRLVFELETGYYVFKLKALEAKELIIVMINSNQAPTTDFIASPKTGIDSLEVTFTDASIAGTFPITSWVWDFGDGTADSTRFFQNPVHFYSNPDTFSVSLTISDGVLSHTLLQKDLIQITATDTSSGE